MHGVIQIDLKQQAKNLPSLPGVYEMKDKEGNIIYIGKSKNLKQRVASYFGASKHQRPKVKRMVMHIDSFEYTLTDTELDALLLECRRIKKIKPLYNTLLKNDKGYRFIYINLQEVFPRFEVSYEKGTEGLYFGPYDIPYLLSTGVEAINHHYGLPTCRKGQEETENCLIYRLKKCIGPCLNKNNERIYKERLNKAVAFLKEEDEEIITSYTKKMEEVARKYEFEKAGKYRDYITVLKMLHLRKEAMAFSLSNAKGIGMVKMPLGEMKFYLFEGTNIKAAWHEVKQLQDLSKKEEEALIERILKNILKYLSLETNRRTYLDKSELDEAQIIYYFISNVEAFYYEKLDMEALQNDIYCKDELRSFIQKGRAYE